MDEPEVAIYDNGSEEWRYENEYPLARTLWEKFYLHEKNISTEPWGSISKVPPTDNEKPDTYRHPRSAFGTTEFLAYTTPPLEEDLVVRGPVSITFYASTTDQNTYDWAFFVKIGDISPSGQTLDTSNNPRDPRNKPFWTDVWTPPDVWLWSYGNLKAKYRDVDERLSRPGQPWHSFQNPADLKPNTIYEFQIELIPIFNTFKKGHKIWLQIAGQDMEYDTQDVFSKNGMSIRPWSYRNAYKSEITVYHSSEYPSHILLPIIPEAPEIAQVNVPLSDVIPGAPLIE
jgi:predicted acyl esterase